MNIKVEVVDDLFSDLSLMVVQNSWLEISIPNKITVPEVIFLIASVFNQNSEQILKVLDKENVLRITCSGFDANLIDTIIFKVPATVDFKSSFGEGRVIDIKGSKFSFEPKLGEPK